jgi:hypothetical protein
MNSLAALLLVTLLPAPEVQSPQRTPVDAAAVRKVGDRLRALQAVDSELLQAIEKLIRDNPKLQPQQLAEKFLADRPELARPENLAKLPKVIESLTETLPAPPQPGPAGGGVTDPILPPVTRQPMPPDPANPPAGGPPVPTPVPDLPPLSNPGGDPAPPVVPPVKPPDVTPAVPPDKPPELPAVPPNKPPELPAVPPVTENSPPAAETVPPVAPPAEAVPPPVSPEDANHRAVTSWWEQNVGPLDDTPALRELLKEMIKGAGASDDKSPLAEFLKDVKGEVPGGLKGWLKDNMPKDVKLSDLGLGGKLPTLPARPDLPTAPPAAPSVSAGDAWKLLAGLGAIGLLAAGYVLLGSKWRDRLAAGRPTPVPGLGPWPIDPRRIATPADLVLAFDYLSVLTIGAGARQYSHLTIANELRRLVPAAAAAADDLGRHYETARYAPSGMVAPEDFAAARAALCELAGVPA